MREELPGHAGPPFLKTRAQYVVAFVVLTALALAAAIMLAPFVIGPG